ncbi:MAG: 4Fe-4S dicluster domain-containing protein [Candidatus Nezhaarchaeota archaeon]|nr:4Fe-4S dicluster domain-containing protein [Candidatus Nezhaarchaeota archaeon]MCX8141413.1 4Fe-4S dicluster domain-containing protein [Candidatus Nezhaarchaeota archaeon]
MRYVKLFKEKFPEFFEALKKWGEVHAPVKHGKFYSFKRVSSPGEVVLDYNRTMIPPKKFFIKPLEAIMKVKVGRGYEPIAEEPKRLVLLGLHACDINGLRILDTVFMDEPKDPYYATRRENAIIVGVSCKPDDHCFCKSMGADYAWVGFDLFLHDIEHSYIIRVGSLKGEEIVEGLGNLMVEPSQEDFIKFRDFELNRSRMFKRALELSHLPEIADALYNSDLWTKFADKCVGCTSCNLVCPTCRCYDVAENVDLSLKEGVRTRRWDSCFIRSHALVAGGLNFRPTRLDRFKHRYNCKSSMEPRTGLCFCVGCGRCSVFCPAGIDHVEVLNTLWGLT